MNAPTLREAAQTLRAYNEWRRGADVPMLEPKAIGEAIDVVLAAIRKMLAGSATSEAKAAAARLNGARGGRPKNLRKPNKKTQQVSSVGNPTLNPTETQHVLVPSILDKPEFHLAWADWLAYRKERRLPVYKATALSAVYAKISHWGLAGAVASIRDSISNQWQGLFEPKPKFNGKKAGGVLEKRFAEAWENA